MTSRRPVHRTASDPAGLTQQTVQSSMEPSMSEKLMNEEVDEVTQ